MATGNLFLGTSRGSVGDVTFSVRGRKQVARARRRVIANPRTFIQVAQRVVVKTCAAAYSVLQPLVCQSFQGYGGRSSNQSRFLKLNIDALRGSLAAAMGGHGLDPDNILDNDTGNLLGSGYSGACINNYTIADGSLLFPGLSLMSSKWFGFPLLSPVSSPTVREFCSLIGAQPGDQLTFVFCFSNSPDHRGYFTDFQFASIILYPSSGNLDDFMFVASLPPNGSVPVYHGNPRNQGRVGFSAAYDGDSFLGIGITRINGRSIVDRSQASEYWPEAAACILSRRVGNRWIYSRARLLGSSDSSSPLNAAVASYLPTQSSSGYLDQAQLI